MTGNDEDDMSRWFVLTWCLGRRDRLSSVMVQISDRAPIHPISPSETRTITKIALEMDKVCINGTEKY